MPDEQLPDDLGVEDGAARRDPPKRIDELAYVSDPVLEEVADPLGAVVQEVACVPLLDVLGQDEDWGAGPSAAELDRAANAFVGERRRQPDVDDSDIGLLALVGLEELRHRSDRRHNLDLVVP